MLVTAPIPSTKMVADLVAPVKLSEFAVMVSTWSLMPEVDETLNQLAGFVITHEVLLVIFTVSLLPVVNPRFIVDGFIAKLATNPS